MKTAWITILGFSSGRTGWVITDGQQPYDNKDKPSSELHGIVNRFDSQDKAELKKIVSEAEVINVMSYTKDKFLSYTKEQVLEAIAGDELGDGYCLLDLMPENT